MTYASPLRRELESSKAAYERRVGECEALRKQLAQRELELEGAQTLGKVLEKARLILKRMADLSRESARQHIETIVTRALQYVFGGTYQFRIVIPDRDRPEATFLVSTEMAGVTIEAEPKDAKGGGVVDVLSLALQVALLLLYRPAVERILVLDEPAKFVSEEYIGAVGKFFKFISDEFGLQVIYVTHNRFLAEMADRTIRIRMYGGISRVE